MGKIMRKSLYCYLKLIILDNSVSYYIALLYGAIFGCSRR